MAALTTPEITPGFKAIDFALKGTDGKVYNLHDVTGPKGTVIMFICNHCPFVKAIAPRLKGDVAELQKLGFGVIAINSNDTIAYPDDSFENMQLFAGQHQFNFPYAIDETQAIAKAYDAVCTPDFFGFNAAGEQVYRGRLDDAGREEKPNSKRELVEAMRYVAEHQKAPAGQKPSIGCNIKWKE